MSTIGRTLECMDKCSYIQPILKQLHEGISELEQKVADAEWALLSRDGRFIPLGSTAMIYTPTDLWAGIRAARKAADSTPADG